ncbi:hypothetical protein CXQ85_003733 [Candidozyma haemuli]|uniref:Major facilitator superfamily (MFS) profile domain-containing protein n=1 Tax=Candidozyma haemuli TaxID=45357 RepID=A0A2V1B140_9ASCO|nr:hypothetical protein CXQ85_003733 [[Candida] haemuloni]PVH23443.1 hypothetical protein CXQ85_003733 [[Candida] haemuloni]
MGYDTMMMSSLIAIPQFTNYFNLTPTTNGLMNASVWIGSIVSCFLMKYMADNWGRKMTILSASLFSFVGVALQTASSDNMGMFIFARVVLGFCTQLTGAASPLMVAEVAPKSIRGFMVGMYFTCFNAGAIIASGITYRTADIHGTWAWRLPSLLQAVPSASAIFLLLFVPESPRWMISKGRLENATKVLKIGNKLSDEEAEVMTGEIQYTIEEEKQGSTGAWLTLLRPARPDQRRLVMIVSLALISELGGSSVGSYYLTVILRQAGITGTDKLLQINLISSCWNFICAVCGAYSFDHFGRKKQAIGSLTGMIVSFALLGGFVKMYGESTNRSGQYATIFFMFLFNGFYNFSITPLNCLYPSELFPMKTRAAGTTIFKFCNCAAGLLGTFILPIAMDNIGWKFYIINAGYDVVFLIVIIVFWVETKGLSLEEIGKSLGEKPVLILSDDSVSVREIQEIHVPKK